MKSKRFRVIATTAAIMLASIAAPVGNVLATETATGVVTADVLNVRSGPATSFSALGFVYDGDKITVLEHADGWYKISFDGKDGYVAEGFLNVTGTPSSGGGSTPDTTQKTCTVNADFLNVRSGASINSERIATIPNGKIVTVLGSENGWYKISFDGKTGYASAEFLTANGDITTETPPTQTPPTETPPTETPSAGKVGVVNADVLNVRSGAGTSNSKISVIYSGKQVNIESTVDGWHKISYDGISGYVSAEFITLKDASATPTPTPPVTETPVENQSGVVTADVLNVRSSAGTEHSKIDSIFSGKSVTVVSSVNGWYQISYDGKTGYVSAEYIDIKATPDLTPPTDNGATGETKFGFVNVSSLNVRSGPSTDNSKLGLIYSGTKVTIEGEENGWYKIAYNGQAGYVSAEFISVSSGDGSTVAPSDSAQAQAFLNIARNELGYSTSDGYTKYGAWYGLPYTAWCAMFVSWCADQAGIDTSIIPRHASCSAGVDWFQNNGTFHSPSGYQPQPGDIAYFTYGHIGIVESVSDSKVTLIEGNTTDAVRRRTYSLDHEYFWGYASPNYTS